MEVLIDRCIVVARNELDSLRQSVPGEELALATHAFRKAESRGFLFCRAVFTEAGEFDGLWERAGEGGDLNWGRGQRIVDRFFFRDGALVPDPDWKPDPALASWEYAGFPCEIRENGTGYNCGYISVPAGHPWHGLDWSAVPAKVHGGCTYSREDRSRAGWWTIGFDCGHAGDAPSPEWIREQIRKYGRSMGATWPGDVYWTVEMVRHEVEGFALQAAQAVRT